MKIFLFGALLSFLMACSNSGTTVKPTDLDRTDNDDTPVVVTDSTVLPKVNKTDSPLTDSVSRNNK